MLTTSHVYTAFAFFLAVLIAFSFVSISHYRRKQLFSRIAADLRLSFSTVEDITLIKKQLDENEVGMVGIIDYWLKPWEASGSYRDFKIEIKRAVANPTAVVLKVYFKRPLGSLVRCSLKYPFGQRVSSHVHGLPKDPSVHGKLIEVLTDNQKFDKEVVVETDERSYTSTVDWIADKTRRDSILRFLRKYQLASITETAVVVPMHDASQSDSKAREFIEEVCMLAQAIQK